MKLPLVVTLSAGALLTVLTAGELSSQEKASRIDSTTLLNDVRVLAHDSLMGRLVGTVGGEKARTFLTRRMTSIGLDPVGPSLLHNFSYQGGRAGGAAAGAPPVEAVNLIGMVKGRTNPGRFIVLTAHYDHVGERNGDVFNGADDNASGTGALLALAAWFRKNPPENSIIFAALDAEEQGLRGAREFVDRPPVPIDSVVMNVNMDMVGRNAAGELYAAGTLHYPFLKPYIETLQPGARVKLLMGHDNVPPGGSRSDDWTNASDHGPFHSKGIPFIYFGVEDHPDYHRPTDEFERLLPGFYVNAVETILDAVLLFDKNLSTIAAARRKF